MFTELKGRLLEAARRAEESGLCQNKSGNFSICDRASGSVIITPSGLSRKEMTVQDFFVVDLKGRMIEKGMNGKPSSELPMHLEAYRCREEISAVVHTHSHYATAFAIRGKKILPVVFEAYFYGVNTEVAEYALSGSPELAQTITVPLQKSDVCLLKSHGVLTVGKDIEETLLKAVYVEDVARLYHYALQLGDGEPDIIPDSEFERYRKSCSGN